MRTLKFTKIFFASVAHNSGNIYTYIIFTSNRYKHINNTHINENDNSNDKNKSLSINRKHT